MRRRHRTFFVFFQFFVLICPAGMIGDGPHPWRLTQLSVSGRFSLSMRSGCSGGGASVARSVLACMYTQNWSRSLEIRGDSWSLSISTWECVESRPFNILGLLRMEVMLSLCEGQVVVRSGTECTVDQCDGNQCWF